MSDIEVSYNFIRICKTALDLYEQSMTELHSGIASGFPDDEATDEIFNQFELIYPEKYDDPKEFSFMFGNRVYGKKFVMKVEIVTENAE